MNSSKSERVKLVVPGMILNAFRISRDGLLRAKVDFLDQKNNISKEDDVSPIFVVGAGHSGTTLMLAILGRHPDLYAVPYETNTFNRLFLTRSVFRVMENLSRTASEAGKLRFIEKTPKHVHWIARIFAFYPQAKVIYMIRDGRDVAASIKKRRGNFKSGLQRWIRDNKNASRWNNDGRVILVRYEDLTENPENTLKQVSEFIEIPFSDCLLSANPSFKWEQGLNNVENSKEKKHSERRVKQINQPLFKNSEAWKNELSDDEIKNFMSKAGNLLHDLGYERKSH